MKLFHNIEKKAVIRKQERSGNTIVPKKRGAPKKPNMVAKKIKVDRVLYQRVKDFCNTHDMTIAYFLSTAIKKALRGN